MQKFVFRAKPTRNLCRRFSSIATSAYGITQRPSLGHGLSRLRVKHSTILFYSSVIATAAAVDVKAKQQRRTHWAKVIAEAESALTTNNVALSGASQDLQFSTISTAAEEDDIQVPSTTCEVDSVKEVQTDVEELRTKVIQALDDTVSSSPGRQWRAWMSPQSMYALPSDRSRPEKWTPKKLLTMEYSVALLVTNLLLALPPGVSIEDPHADTTSQLRELANTRAEILDNLTSIKAHGPYVTRGLHRVEHPRYLYVYDAHDRKRRTATLNRLLLHILQQHSSGNIELQEAVVKITYELLNSQHPPNVKTYTLLIHRFSRLGQHSLVDIVIESLHQSHTRMNEITVASILTHYTRRHDLVGFTQFVGKLQGLSGGLMLAHPETKMDVPESHRHRQGSKIIMPFNPDARVYYAIIKGFLSFDKFHVASEWYAQMRGQDIQPDMALKNDYLFFYAKNSLSRSWRWGLGTWKSIKNSLVNTPHTQVDRHNELNAYRRMMLLCKNHSKPLDFKRVYQEALSRGYSLSALLELQPKYMPATPARDAAESMRRRLWVTERRAKKQEDELARLRLEVVGSELPPATDSVTQPRESMTPVSPELLGADWPLHYVPGKPPHRKLWDGRLRLRSVWAERRTRVRRVAMRRAARAHPRTSRFTFRMEEPQ